MFTYLYIKIIYTCINWSSSTTPSSLCFQPCTCPWVQRSRVLHLQQIKHTTIQCTVHKCFRDYIWVFLWFTICSYFSLFLLNIISQPRKKEKGDESTVKWVKLQRHSRKNWTHDKENQGHLGLRVRCQFFPITFTSSLHFTVWDSSRTTLHQFTLRRGQNCSANPDPCLVACVALLKSLPNVAYVVITWRIVELETICKVLKIPCIFEGSYSKKRVSIQQWIGIRIHTMSNFESFFGSRILKTKTRNFERIYRLRLMNSKWRTAACETCNYANARHSIWQFHLYSWLIIFGSG